MKILSPKLSSLKNAKNETNETKVMIPLRGLPLNADKKPIIAVVSKINVVIFSINPSSSEMLLAASGDREAVNINATPASMRKIKCFGFMFDLCKSFLFFLVIEFAK